MIAKNVEILSEEIKQKYHIKSIYVKVKCDDCGSTWGITCPDNLAPEDKLVCRECAVKQQIEQANK
jgi:hypothetical protein